MTWVRVGRDLGAAAMLVQLLCGCLQPDRRADFNLIESPRVRSAGFGLAVRWAREIAPVGAGSYIPVEQATPGVDAVRDRIYVGSTHGTLFGFDNSGKTVFEYDTKGGVEAQPVVDGKRDELYVATVRGTVLALRASDASRRWQVETGAAISQPPVLSADAIYAVTDGDTVVAIARADGAILWRYHREPREGFSITGHAGLTQLNGRLLTGFGDGTVVALDASDGHVLWEVETALDLEEVDPTRRFTDVDTTPAVAGDTVYAASFSGGLYAIQLATGSMQRHHAELRGVTGVSATADALVVTSAERGVLCLELPTLNLRWQRRIERGSPGRAEIRGDNLYVTESQGALLVLALADGQERGRLETGHGITAPAALDSGRGFILSNAGTLYAFSY